VLVCDIDHFKSVNDRNGHATGDLVLSIARILSRHGFAGRIGGDEFVLLCAEPAGGARATAAQILDDVRAAFAGGSVEGWEAGARDGAAARPRRAAQGRRRRALRGQARRRGRIAVAA